jgi:dCMP deaminase
LIYVPVIHDGYIQLFKRNRGSHLVLIGDDILTGFGQPIEIRAMPIDSARELLDRSGWFKSVSKARLSELGNLSPPLVMIDDDLSRQISQVYFATAEVVFESVRLRWDQVSIREASDVDYDRVSSKVLDQRLISQAKAVGESSSDWWRQVGAIAVLADGSVIAAYNQHVPTPQAHYAEGDPRDFISAGVESGLGTALHAEASIVCRAARAGISLEGAKIYVSLFPCPVCAKLIAYAGCKAVYFDAGHTSLDGVTVLRHHGVEIVLVN